MRIVSENSPDDIKRHREQARVNRALRVLAANIMRVARGAGRPEELGLNAQAVVETMVAYHEAVGHYPPSEELAVSLPIENSAEIMERVGSEGRTRLRAEQDMIRGALQVAASRLLGQGTQESMGRTEMMRGFHALEDAEAQSRLRWARQHSAPKVARSPKKKKAKPKAPLIDL